MGRQTPIYANVIIDIGHPDVDRTFDYIVPGSLAERIRPGSPVEVPFGRGSRPVKGYVTGLSDTCSFDPEKLKEISAVLEKDIGPESRMIELAGWMRDTYGCTMIQALKTVLPVKQKVAGRPVRTVRALVPSEELAAQLAAAKAKHFHARARVLEALLKDRTVPFSIMAKNLSVTMATLKPLQKAGIIEIEEKALRRQKLCARTDAPEVKALNDAQQRIADGIMAGFDSGDMRPCLIHGVTASGKTEIYMELIARVLEQGKQAIVLIPEIALTYAAMMRFYRRFGDRVGFVHSRLSEGEKYEQLSLAASGGIDIMIGPRSALFTPFPSPGLIVIDEEHDGAYDSETAPRYHAVEAAGKLSELTGAGLILGSATPSLRSFSRAKSGEYRLFQIKERARQGARPAEVTVADMRQELMQGNRSPFSAKLSEALQRTLDHGGQAMLFLNRRGYSSFVSCRACGHVMKCPHCDVSLSFHKNSGHLHCHYCGHEEPWPAVCPECGSKYISGFRGGTQKIEEYVNEAFPQARVIRMDYDTTRAKDSYQKIINTFASGGADVLIGTQMIVKGHDFPGVSLMGVLAADLSLYAPDYTAAERTFQLLTQAAGRAGRAEVPGEVIIQTYTPDHYSIQTAAAQDYEAFYEEEIVYRQMLGYPPVRSMLSCVVTAEDEREAQAAAQLLAELAREAGDTDVFGPSDDVISRMHDRWRKALYVKADLEEQLIRVRQTWDAACENGDIPKRVRLAYDIS